MEWGTPAHVAWNGAWLLVWLAAAVGLWRDRRHLTGWLGGVWALGVLTIGVGRSGYWLPVGAVLYFADRLRRSRVHGASK